ncbi:acetate kinase [Candidatus Woesearchaeota archaeon]|nr:acetate kinase [Candidatus Woesearchaeota archaeon]
MKILVLNTGSSSVKFKLFDKEQVLAHGLIEEIGLKNSSFIFNGHRTKAKVNDPTAALKLVFDYLKSDILGSLSEINAVGHRVVHGGDKFYKPTLINKNVIDSIRKFSSLAPLHNPSNLSGIMACKKLLPKVKQFAVFDTAFHQTIPKEAFLYGIPLKYYRKYKIRKYGFHGTNHQYMYEEACRILGRKLKKVITCHLGNGSSVTAIKEGKSIDTSMGFTPLQGLMMGTRSGDIDPEIIEYIMKKEHKSIAQVMLLLNKNSGLKGLTGNSDFRLVVKKSMKGDKNASLGLKMYLYKLEEYIGAYRELLQGLDALVISGGIGEYNPFVRSRICKSLGIKINKKANAKNKTILSKKPAVLIIKANEELMIARKIHSKI